MKQDMETTLMKKSKSRKSDVPPGYKRTEVGVIPNDWEVEKLGGAINSIQSGKSKSYNDNGVYPFLGSKGLIGYKNTFDYEGDKILIARVGAYAGSIYIVSGKYCVSDNTLILDNRDFVLKFLYYLIQNLKINKLVFGSGQPLVTGTQLKNLEVSLPPQYEQQAIATALSDVDQLIESLDNLIAKKRAIKQATMQQLLTGKRRLPGFNGKWEKKRLGDMGSFFGGLTGKTKKDFGNGTARYVPFLNVMMNVVIDKAFLDLVYVAAKEDQNQLLQGDLIFNGTSETPEEVGMCSVLLDDLGKLYLNSFCIAFRMKSDHVADSLYLAYYFRSDEGRNIMKSLAQGATRYNLSKSALKDVHFPLPEISEQKTIAKVLFDIDSELKVLEMRRDKVRQIKQGMMQELLTGRTRLVKQASTQQSETEGEVKVRSINSKGHNWQFNEAVVIAVLAGECGKEDFPLSRFRYTKFSYLLHRYAENKAEGYLKKAAGPYNPSTRYKGPEKIALKNQYVEEKQTENYTGFIAGEKLADAREYFEKWYGQEVLDWLKQFQYEKSESLELLTTVDMAIQNLKEIGKEISAKSVESLINDHAEWRPKLKRNTFSLNRIEKTIIKLKQVFKETS